tara:strand:- start:216 stop:746 length:531 start_codon:yes stop_codon:yes gene_type:complete
LLKHKLISYFKVPHIPNIITLLRIFLSLPLIFFLENNNLNIVWILIIVGAVSDYLDGYLARKLKIKSKFGAIIDPLSDKIFTLIPLIWLCLFNLIPFWSLSIILLREFIVSAIRKNSEDGLPAIRLGKVKTFSFFTFLIIIFSPYQDDLLLRIGYVMYWLGFLLSLITIKNYLKSK